MEGGGVPPAMRFAPTRGPSHTVALTVPPKGVTPYLLPLLCSPLRPLLRALHLPPQTPEWVLYANPSIWNLSRA